MITLWGFILGLPLLAFGGVLLLSPGLARRFVEWFRGSRSVAAVLTTVAWFWTAYECDNLGIASIDRFTKMFPGQLWVMATVLVPLTIAWMPKSLSVRALSGVLMLMPAELFKTTHMYRPPSGVLFAPIDLFVYAAYVGIVTGMYGMFYPWSLEAKMDRLLASGVAARAAGGALAALGAAIITTGCLI